MPENNATQGLILILSGPAGSGKTTLCDRLIEKYPRVTRLVTTTTRVPREGEVNGVDYHFVDEAAFLQGIEQNAFIEWAKVHGRYYGSRRSDILSMLEADQDVLLNIDVQGAHSFRTRVSADPQFAKRLVTVFLQPESLEQIEERLKQRGTDSEEEIARRLNSAKQEQEHRARFDHVIVSGTRDEDFARFQKIYLNERNKRA